MVTLPTPGFVLRLMESRNSWAWWRLPEDIRQSEPKRVALTLDDGPSEKYALDVLAALKEEGVRATFFVLGDRCQAFPEVLYKMAEDGHGIGLHGDTHMAFTGKSKGWKARLDANELIIKQILGPDLAGQALQSYFRPPFGKVRSDWVEEILKDRKIVNCSILPGKLTYFPRGWVEPPPVAANTVKNELHPGAIIALHCGQRLADGNSFLDDDVYDVPLAGRAVKAVCQAVQAAGYELDRLP